MFDKLLNLTRRARYEGIKYGNGAISVAKTHRKTAIGVALATSMALFISIVAVGLINSYAYAVVVDGKTIGYVNNKTEYNQLVDDVKQELKAEDVNVNEIFSEVAIASEPTNTLKSEVDMMDEPTLKEKIVEKSSVYANGYEIAIGQETLGVVALASDAKLIEQKIKDRFKPEQDEKILKEEINGALAAGKVHTELNKLTSTDDIVEKILRGRDEVKIYTAKEDDTLWGIAVAHGLTEADVLTANPGLDPKLIHAGDSIKLNKPSPFLTYTVVTQAKRTERQAYETVTKETSSLFSGQTKVEQEGKDGERIVEREYTRVNGEVVNAKELSSQIISEPVNKVVLKGTKRSTSNYGSYNYPPAATGNGSLEALLATARAQLGKPYRYGAAGPNAFDCSGFVTYVYNQSGYAHISRGSAASMYARSQKVSREQAQAGDMVFFTGTTNAGGITHVGLYIGGGMMIHASNRGIAYDSLNSDYRISHLYGFGRL